MALLADELLLDVELDGGADEGIVGGEALGVAGGWGMVGLLALGQPLSNRQAEAATAAAPSNRVNSLVYVIGPDQFICPRRLARDETGPEMRIAQVPHQPNCRTIGLRVLIQALQVNHPTP